jgi:hypothetical protein
MSRPILHLPFPKQPRHKLKGGSLHVRSTAPVPQSQNPHYEVEHQPIATESHPTRMQYNNRSTHPTTKGHPK